MSQTNETSQERQENELEVLQAVFSEDCQDLRHKDAWKVFRPPEMTITLVPQESMSGLKEVHVRVDLHIKCGKLYPDEIPEISLENAKGLSKQCLGELTKELVELAIKLRGEVMILELAQHVQNFLHLHNKPRFTSFYDEMMSNHKKQEEEVVKEQQRQLQLQKLQADKQRKAIEEEIHRKQEAIKEEARLRKELTKQFSKPLPSDTYHPSILPLSPLHAARRERSHSIETTQPSTPSPNGQNLYGDRRKRQSSCQLEKDAGAKLCNHSKTATIDFKYKNERMIQRGKCLGHSWCGRISYVGIDGVNGELVLVSEWLLKWRHVKHKSSSKTNTEQSTELQNYLKQVTSIEREMGSLFRLQHHGLVAYQGMKFFVDRDNIVIQVLQEFVLGRNIKETDGPSLSLDFLRHYICEVVEVLVYLHRNSVVHKDLRLANIFEENTGRIRVADYGIDKRLCDLYALVNEDVAVIAQYSPSVGRGAKKGDIYRLGVVILSLMVGHIVSDIVPEVPKTLPLGLIDLLEKCLMRSEQDRWSADQLLDHSFLKASLHCSPNADVENENKPPVQSDEIEEPDTDIPLLNLSSVHGPSRLQNEFEILKWLGKGGFGDVLKARNKLDSRVYAIKRIVLNQHGKLLNKKITREVKLLSRLNHENVVRYFYSWIEMVNVDTADMTTDSGSLSISRTDTVSSIDKKQKTRATVYDDIERLAPAKVDASVEWSHSLGQNAQHHSTVSDNSSDEDEDYFCVDLFQDSDSSESIIFENETNATNSSIQSSVKDFPSVSTGETTTEDYPKTIQFMYIQMEFCEKSTLRNAIDMGLNEDESRMWRLFREILEGLAHIHQQGMIHRDLKPANIFLDSDDHVKIGDFGLATTDIIAKSTRLDGTASVMSDSKPNADMTISRSDQMDDGTTTGCVGTELYVAPELSTAIKVTYSQKVDIYSVGIMFFEMCYHPLPTAMERVKVLHNIRHVEINFPVDFDEKTMSQQACIVRWMLDHEPSKRPTSLELLQSEYLPPPQMEEAELQEMLRHTINNPQSKSYKHMISSLFKQDVSAAADFTYDMGNYRGIFNNRILLTQKFVRNELSRIFQKHGALNVITPLLLPKSPFYEENDSCVNVLDHNGGVISLPFELRLSFARYIVKNNITNLRRYAISRVYREKKVFGCQPRELFECAFDIVTPNPGSALADAEVLFVIWEVISEFPALQNRSYVICLNHSALVKAVLIHCGIPDEKHSDVYSIMGDTKLENWSKFKTQIKLTNLCLTDQTISILLNFIELEGSINKVNAAFKSMIDRKGAAAAYAKQGLRELESVIKYAEILGVKAQIVITPGLVYGIRQFLGLFFKVTCELKKKHGKVSHDVLAAGGRYDSLISSMYFTPTSSNVREASQSVIGVSFALEKIVSAVLEDEEFKPPSAYDVLVCSVGQHLMPKEKAAIIKDLWNGGIRAQMHYDDSPVRLEAIQDVCRESGIPFIVVLKDAESGLARLRWWEKDKFVEKKLTIGELVDHLQKCLSDVPDASFQAVFRCDSTKSFVSNEQLSVPSAANNVNITFVSLEKLPPNTKKRHEGQITSHVMTAIQHLSPKTRVEIVAFDLNRQILKTITSQIELDSESAFKENIGSVIEKHPRHRKYLRLIFDEIHELKFQKQQDAIIMLYGLADNSYKLLL